MPSRTLVGSSSRVKRSLGHTGVMGDEAGTPASDDGVAEDMLEVVTQSRRWHDGVRGGVVRRRGRMSGG